jgi:hypothetical protein
MAAEIGAVLAAPFTQRGALFLLMSFDAVAK